MKSFLAFSLVSLGVLGCSGNAQRIDPSESASCTCEAGQKFDGTACVAEADFAAPTCNAAGGVVCGCDSVDYDSGCDASKAGVQVAFTGECQPPAPPRGLGW
ncbi:MAG: hypothetical protein Q8O67_16735 [Deltaproteobacteria bacterium]|nr:hypothetical protein [Deltaproteobacteria bacterium]